MSTNAGGGVQLNYVQHPAPFSRATAPSPIVGLCLYLVYSKLLKSTAASNAGVYQQEAQLSQLSFLLIPNLKKKLLKLSHKMLCTKPKLSDCCYAFQARHLSLLRNECILRSSMHSLHTVCTRMHTVCTRMHSDDRPCHDHLLYLARRFLSLNILLSHSKSLKVIRNDTVE